MGAFAFILSQDTARQAMGAGFRLDANEKNRSKRMAEISERIGEDTEGSLEGVHQKKIETAYGIQWVGWADNFFETLQLSDIEALAAVEGISDYNITTCVTTVRPVGFRRIEDPDADQHEDLGCVTLLGNRNMELGSNVLSVVSANFIAEAFLIASLAFVLSLLAGLSVPTGGEIRYDGKPVGTRNLREHRKNHDR